MPIGNTTFVIHHIKDIGFSGAGAGGGAENGGRVEVRKGEGVAGEVGFGLWGGWGRGVVGVWEEGVEEECVHVCGRIVFIKPWARTKSDELCRVVALFMEIYNCSTSI